MRWPWKEEKGYQGENRQGMKMNCVKAYNKTFTRPRLLHLLQVQGEEKAFPIGHPLPPNCP